MMTRRSLSTFVVGALLAVLPAGQAMAAAHVRGTVAGVKDGTISVQTTGGAEDIKAPAGTPLFLVSKTDLSAVQAGKFIGVTSVEKDGKRVAKEVHVFADSLRGLAEGHYPWDLGSERNMMTNANIATVNTVGADRELKLNYKGGEQTIEVPDNAPIVAFDKAGPDQLVVGRKVFIILKDGAKDAAAVVIGADGVQPPM
jgi:hypothetical protein